MQIHVQHTTESPNGGYMDKTEQKENSKWGWGGKPRLPAEESVFKWKEHDFEGQITRDTNPCVTLDKPLILSKADCRHL